MSFLLSNFLGGTSSTGGDSSYSDENKQLIVEKLTTKMTNSAHLEDRKAAALTIKSLARSHRLEIGTLALQALIDELRRDLEDEELAKIVLETLDILCSSSLNENEGIEVQFCEILLKDEGNVALLLDLMGNSEDFYLRFTSIQILISLCNSQPFQLQSAVLNSPSGVEKVLNLLKDSREIVRNEGLLLCGALVRGNPDLQKILAFQGAFEEVMKIIVDEEGPWTGPLIIQDAFNLISGMLNLNTSNQNYFRDSICFKQLAGLLSLPQEEDAGLWNSTRISNYLAALNILDGILCKENVDLSASQNAAMRTHFQGPLLILAFTPKIPLQVSASALNCLSGLIWSNNRAQQEFASQKLIKIPSSNCLMKIEPPISPLMAAIIWAVHGNTTQEGVEQRIKALEVVEAFCSGNSEGQLVLLSTLKASGSASPGTVILDALFDLDASRKRDPWHCWYASILLCHLIDANEEAKKVLLNHRVVDAEIEDEGEDLLTSLMLNMIRIATDSRGSTCQKSIIGYLQLLVIWFHESSASIKAFLSESSFLQYLLERTTQQPQELEIQGLAALIFGICVLFNDESVERVGSEALKGIIKNRIGPDLFVSRLSRLKSNIDKNELICELSKGILLKNYESLMNMVVRPTPVGSKASHTATLAQLSKDLAESRALLATSQASLIETTNLADKLKIGISERDAYILQLQKFISEKNQKIAQMAHEMSSHYDQQQMTVPSYEKCLADQEALKSLNNTIKSFQETVARQQARIEELEALLRETEEKDSELEKWKVAYHKLYEQVQEQLNFVDLNDERVNDFEKVDNPLIVNDKSEPLIVEECPSTNDSIDNTYNGLTVHSDQSNVEVLSPSLFMSPLAESEQVLCEPEILEPVSENSLSPELASVNQIPLRETMNEYPNLTSELDTSFTAALIVSEDFANNEPNPSTDEAIENISSECPPDNFLASDPDDNVELVSSEEIKNVLRFFDELPEDSVAEIQEELDQIHLNEEHEEQGYLNEVLDQQANEGLDQQVPDTAELDEHVNDSFELPADMNENDEFEYYAESNFNNIPKEQVQEEYEESHLGYAAEEQPADEVEAYEYSYDQMSHQSQEFEGHEQVYTEEPQKSEYQQESAKEPVENEYVETPVGHQEQEYTEAPYEQPEYSAEQSYGYDQPQEYTIEEPYSHDQQEESYQQPEEFYNYEQPQEYYHQDDATAQDQQQEPVASIDDYFSQEASQDFLQEYSGEGQYTENGTVYAEGQMNDDSAYNQGYAADGFATEGYPADNEYTQEHAVEAQEYATDAQGYSTETQEHTVEGYGETQEYNTEGQEGYGDQTQEYNNNQAYSAEGQEYNDQVYSAEYTAQDYTAQSQDYSYDQVQDYSTADYSTQTQDYSTQTQNYSTQTQDYSTDSLAQSQGYTQDGSVGYVGHGQNQDYSASAYSTEATDYSEYPTEYSTTDYSTDQPIEYAQDQSTYEQDQYQQEQQDQNTTATTADTSEYYYYDEATGYTYGFDQNVNQYYYYDPNTGEYVYYTAPETESVETPAVEESIASSNPSLFEPAGPPMVSLQQSTPHVESQLHQSFVADPVYNL